MPDIGIVYNKKLKYPKFPFNPDKLYQELDYKYDPQVDNLIYAEMRNLFYKMNYDKNNFGTKEWNPLGFLIKKGDKVLIKPNFVLEYEKSPFCVITHPSILRFLIDYAFIATGESGEIIVGDAPQMNADINKIKKFTKIDKLVEFLRKKKIPVKFMDFRAEIIEEKKRIPLKRKKISTDQVNGMIIDLKENSQLFELEKNSNSNFYGADYNRTIVNSNHNILRNLYYVSKVFLDSDVVISVPKLKTHKKAGVTLNLKNFVGINIHKNYLPHYRIGCPKQNGDSFPNMNSFLNFSRFLLYLFRDIFLSNHRSRLGKWIYILLRSRVIFEYFIVRLFFPRFFYHYYYMIDGNWSGNDTVWRTILDLNIILRFTNKNGYLKKTPQKKLFSVIDGIIGGEKDGPLNPNPRNEGVILIGNNLLLTDLVATKIMGFDYMKIPLLKNALTLKNYDFINKNDMDRISIISNNEQLNNINYNNLNLSLNFIPPTGWLDILKKN